jgi:hypothetical protein
MILLKEIEINPNAPPQRTKGVSTGSDHSEWAISRVTLGSNTDLKYPGRMIT